MKKVHPVMGLPTVVIEVPDNKEGIDGLLEDLDILKEYREGIKEEILAHPKCNLIIALLNELRDMRYCSLNHCNKYKLLSITRDLSKIDAPVIPNTIGVELRYPMRWEDWSIGDITREYLEVYTLRGQEPKVPLKSRYLKREVLEMLLFLLDCKVIYNFKRTNLFRNSIKGELESYFRDYKRIRVEVL